MTSTATLHQKHVASSDVPDARAPGRGSRWARFLAGLLLILLFAFGVIPAWQRLGPVREVRDAIRSRGIDATALLYTESEVSGEAEAAIRGLSPSRRTSSVETLARSFM